MSLRMDTQAIGVFAAGLLVGLGLFFVLASAPRAHASLLADQIICLEYSANNSIIGSLVTLQSDTGNCGTNATSTQTAVLTVIKLVDNSAGGTATSSDFTMHVSAASSSASSFPGSATGSTVALDPGSYSVSETGGPADYTATLSADCTGTVASGDVKTCTIINTYAAPVPPHATSSDLSVLKSVSSSTPTEGSDITYTIAVHNAGPDDATGVIVSDLLPSGLTYVSDNGSGSYASSTGDWAVGSLADGATSTLSILTLVGSTTSAITNTASISASSSTDPVSSNNTSSVTITPQASSTSNNNNGGGGNTGGGGNGGGGGGGGSTSPTPSTPTGSGGGNGIPSIIGQVNFTGGGLVLGTSTEAATTTVCGPLLSTYMRLGMKNESSEVIKLQTFLNNFIGARLPVTGFFGKLTDAAVRTFQIKYGGQVLAPWVPYGLPNAETSTGYVYKTTQREINNLYCASLNLPLPVLP